MEERGVPLTVSCFQSCIDANFWYIATKRKLEEWKLDESPVPLLGYYGNCQAEGLPPRLTVDFEAFNADQSPPPNHFASHGKAYLLNTLEGFKLAYAQKRLEEAGLEILEEIRSGSWRQDPSRLCRFVLVAHIDPKRYFYSYVVGHPVVQQRDAPLLVGKDVKRIGDALLDHQIEAIRQIGEERSRLGEGFFMVVQVDRGAFRLVCFDHPLAGEVPSSKVILVFCDPSSNGFLPGWPLRNIIAAWRSFRPDDESVRVLCWRRRYVDDRLDCSHSVLMDVLCKDAKGEDGPTKVLHGLERNSDDSIAVRRLDLSASMEPNKLADNATKLNLNLMRWRIVPELQLDVVYGTSCLLFGAGTLGCNIARCLGAWGVRKVTLIDNGRVSYSNPARQSLFSIEDCLNGGRYKHEAAADALRRIYPAMEVESYGIEVPTPGSKIEERDHARVKEIIALIEKLIEEHDVVFLLLDTREGRWLPSVLSTYHSKLTFTVALGFDSYLVLRHGIGCQIQDNDGQAFRCSEKPIRGRDLACYFCCDVVAPGNSTLNRTIDQQCTVTRPGVSMMAAGVAVELLVSVLQHPLKAEAHAYTSETGSYATCLGAVPHQIRGYLSRFEQMSLSVQRFHKCVACSSQIVQAYRSGRSEFVINVCNQPLLLEQLTGLDILRESAEDAGVIDFVDSDTS